MPREFKWISCCLLPFIMACQIMGGGTRGPAIGLEEIRPVIRNVQPDESIAVSWVYEAGSYDITTLGNWWRSRIEKALRDNGLRVKARKDVGLIIEDLESYGKSRPEADVWEKAGADIIINGNYRLLYDNPDQPKLLLHIKALRIETAELIGSNEWKKDLASDWEQLAFKTVGNVYYQKLDTIASPGADVKKPELAARMDRRSRCYPPGDEGRIYVTSEPGVYLYILNLLADNTVVMLYPNRFCPHQPLEGQNFTFPPVDNKENMALQFFPIESGKTCRESIKVIASRHQFDFSFLPVPMNQMYYGARGGDIKKVYKTLDKADAWSKVELNYKIAPGCND